MKRRRSLMFVVAVSLLSVFVTGLSGLKQPTPALASGGVANLQADEFSAWFGVLSPAGVKPNVESTLRLPVERQAGQAVLLATPALTVTRTSLIRGGGSLQPDEEVTYAIAISNGGSSAATGVVVSDNFPADTTYVPNGLTITPVSAGGTTGTPATQPNIASGMTVAAGSLVPVTFAATVDPSVAGEKEIVNAARVTGTEDIGPATATELEAQAEPINFSVFKNAFPTSVLESGEPVTFSVEIINFSQTASVTIDLLTDDIHGNLNGQGSCSVPQDIVAGGNYACDFTVTVSGDFGVPEIDTVMAHGKDDEGNMLIKFANATVNFIDVPTSSITVTQTPSPSSIPEPGDVVDFTVTMNNTSPGDSVTFTSLSDSRHGDLNGQGDCSVPQTVPRMTARQCTYTATVTGNAGDTETSTVTVNAIDDDGVSLSAVNTTTVTLFDVQPSISVSKTANPTMVNEPGGPVNFTIQVQNTSPGDSVTLTSLSDNQHGNLDSQGNCAVPRSIALGGSYQCNYTVMVSGVEGGSQTSTVTAEVSDDEGNETSDSDSATVTIGATLPIYLPLIQLSLTELYVLNLTGADITFTVIGTSVVDCLVPDNITKMCGTFPAGTYTVRAVTSVCGTGVTEITYGPGPVDPPTTVFCES